jgi:hypothetical protein
VTIACVSVASNHERSDWGFGFCSISVPASFAYSSGQYGIMSQISIIFGMPLMITMDTEGPNCDRTPELQEHFDRLVAGLPPNSNNRSVELLLIYMSNHIDSADKNFGTIPER